MVSQKQSVCILITIGFVIVETSTAVNTVDFVTTSRCLDNSCTNIEKRQTRDAMDCASSCMNVSSCGGFRIVHHDDCTLLPPECFLNSSCSHSEPDVQVFERQTSVCQNGGVLQDAQNQLCRCIGGWLGSRCERPPVGCEKLHAMNFANGIHWTSQSLQQNRSTTELKCDLRPREVLTYIFASDGTKNHSRPWHDYVNGYKLDDNNFWLGLEPMLILNTAGHTDVILSLVLTDPSGTTINYRNQYPAFAMEDASNKYQFTVGRVNASSNLLQPASGLPPVLLDVLQPCANKPFLTFDADNTNGCANKGGAGWWFSHCSPVLTINPLGFLKSTVSFLPIDAYFKLPGLDLDLASNRNLGVNIYMVFTTEY